jgi:acyl carrier protein
MTHSEQLAHVFAETLGIDIDTVIDSLQYNSIPEWDSVNHMALVVAIDAEFDITMDTDDVIDMSSFGKAKELLAKYNLDFSK